MPEGDVLVGGRYELLEEIGRGGSAVVHRAVDRRSGTSVAVKVARTADDAGSHLRRRHEAEILASIRHPALVTVLDQCVDRESTAVVMELMEHGTLRDRLRQGPLDPDAVAAMGAVIASALAHVHANGIVHRDIKPANLLLTSPDARSAKLTDFGIAKLLETASHSTSGVVGTVLYLSPEQAQGGTVGTASDIYSLGLTLFECLTGRPAFPGSVAESLAARLLRDPDLPAAFGYGWRSLIRAMTARDPAERPSADEVVGRLLSLEDAGSVPTVEITAVLPAAPRTLHRRRGRIRIGIAAATVSVVSSAMLAAAAPAYGPAYAAPGETATPVSTASAAPFAATERTEVRVGPSSGTDRAAGTTKHRAAPAPAPAKAVRSTKPAKHRKGGGKTTRSPRGKAEGHQHGAATHAGHRGR